MTTAQAFVKADLGAYLAKQGAKGTAATALKGAISFDSFTNQPEIEKVDGVPLLGPNGFYMQQSVGTSVKTTQTASGQVTTGLFPSMVLAGFMSKGSTTGSAAYTHPYTMIPKNSALPYLTIGLVFGESTTAGSGIMTDIIRDARITKFGLSIDSQDFVKFTAQWMGLNMGPGGGSETFTPNTAYNIPNPNGAANTYTFPSWVPAGACPQSVQIDWNAETVQTKPCLGAGEHGDTLITKAGWTLTFKFQADANAVAIRNNILGKADTMAVGTSSLLPGLKTGAFSFLANSDTLIPTTSTPYSIAGSFPSLQWVSADWSDESPNELTVVAQSFGSDQTFTVVNNLASGAMVI